MQRPLATVISIDRGSVTVAVADSAGCARCAAGKGCGAGLGGSRRGPRELTLPLPPLLALRRGDTVSLQLLPARLLQASLLAYGLPLMCMLLLPVLAEWLFGPLGDARLVVIALAGVALAIAGGRRWLAQTTCARQLVPGIAGREGSP